MSRRMIQMKELIEDISMGPFGSDIKVDNFIDQGVPVLNGSNIRGVKLSEESFNYVSEEKAKSLKKANTKRGDIVITHRGTLGQISYIPDDSLFDNYIISQSQFRVTLKKNIVNPIYFTYYFHTSEGQKRLLSFKNHVGVPALAQATTNFRLLDFPIRPINEQNAIAKVLSDLDAKIELNNKINGELEAMAKLIYDYWFVQFDFPYDFKQGKVADDSSNPKDVEPYKSSGGKMVYNAELKREIPEGWEVGTFGDYSKSKGGFAFKSKWWADSGIPVVKIKDINENLSIDIQNLACVNKEHAESASKYKLKPGDVVIAMTGATIGKFGVIPRSDDTILVNQRVGFFELGSEPLNKLPFLINSLSQKYFRENVFLIASGAAQPNISNRQIDSIPLIKPPELIINIYNQKLKYSYSRIINNSYENQQLSSLRDWLLPMLMNGQVTVGSVSREQEGKSYENDFEVGVAAEGGEEYKKKPHQKSAIPPRNYLTLIKSNFSDFENQATLGEGIYTIPDLANILKQPIDKVRRWINTFFDDKFANEFKANYSWKVDKSKAVNFYTMIELVTMFNLSKQGLSTREIVKSHNSLVKMYHTPHPYADKKVMEDLKINGKKLIAKLNGIYVNTDGSNQLNFNFISQLLENIDFDDNLAIRYYPMGKENSIVIDPKRKFGSAVVGGTNIYPETLYSYYKGGENIKYIAALFEIDEQMVKDAISFCKSAA